MFIARILFSATLFVGALLHAYGSFLAFPQKGPALVWSVGASGFAILLSAISILAAYRPADLPLAATALAGAIGWVIVVLCYGWSIGNVADPRVLYHAITGIVIAALTLVALQTA